MVSKLDTRQIINRAALDGLDQSAPARLDVTLGAVNALATMTKNEINTGFLTWSGSGNYFSTSGAFFSLLRGGTVGIKNIQVTFAATSNLLLSANFTYFIAVNSSGTVSATKYSDVTETFFDNNAVLFEVLYDGTNMVVVKENHPYAFQVGPSRFLHNNVGPVIRGTGAIITRVSANAGASQTDVQIKIVGADTLEDHGLTTAIGEVNPQAFNFMYKNASGKWIKYSTASNFPLVYNNAGTITALGTGPNTDTAIMTLYVSKDNLNSPDPIYFAVIDSAVYNTIAAAQAALSTGTHSISDNELAALELAQLGNIIIVNNGTYGYIDTPIIAKSTFNSKLVGGGASTSSHLLLSDINGGAFGDGGHSALVSKIESASDPTVSDSSYKLGTIWINTTSKTLFTLSDNTSGAAIWVASGGLGAWATGKSYQVGNIVTKDLYGLGNYENLRIYKCKTAHTSGTFTTDYASGYWFEVSKSPARFENYVENNRAEADLAGWEGYLESKVAQAVWSSTTDILTDSGGHGFVDGQRVYIPTIYTGFFKPGGVNVDTIYFVKVLSSTTYQLSLTLGGASIDLTDSKSYVFTNFIYWYFLTPTNGSNTQTPPSITLSRNTSSPLSGFSDFKITKTAVDYVGGYGFKYPFSIEPKDKGQILEISFPIVLDSGTYVSNENSSSLLSDLTVWVYDITNSRLIQPTGYKIVPFSTGLSTTFKAQFQSSIDSTSYRLLIHHSSVSASAWTLRFSDVMVKAVNRGYGSPITDWQAYTPTLSGLGNATSSGFWRRNGDTLDCNIVVTIGATLPTTTFQATIPTGMIIDQAKVIYSNAQALGVASSGTAGPAHLGTIVITGPNVVGPAGDDGTSWWTSTNPITWAAGDKFTLRFSVPITGWSSNVIMSSDADTRVVAARYSNAATQAVANNTNTFLDFATKNHDTHSAVLGAGNGAQTTSGTTWRYVCPVPGIYQASAAVLITTTTTWAVGEEGTLKLYKNGSPVAFIGRIDNYGSTASYMYPQGNTTVECKAGDYLEIVMIQTSGGTLNIHNDANISYVDIFRLSGPTQIAASDKVYAEYTTNAGQTIANNATAIINFEDKVVDTHNAVTVGASWKFTAPRAGIYDLQCMYLLSSDNAWALNEECDLNFKVNGVTTKLFSNQRAQAALNYFSANASSSVYLKQGDTLAIELFQNSGGTVTLYSAALGNWITISST